jgi:hypothetical protein
MNKQMLEQVEAILQTCDLIKTRPYLEVEEIRVFLEGYREEPKGKEAELARVRVRVFELFKELAADTMKAKEWTPEERARRAAWAEAGMFAELQRRAAEIDEPRDFGVSWARVIERRRG